MWTVSLVPSLLIDDLYPLLQNGIALARLRLRRHAVSVDLQLATQVLWTALVFDPL